MTVHTRIPLPFLLLVAAGLLVSACKPQGPGLEEGECIDDGDCSAEGGMQACVNSECEAVDCLTSNDCPLGTHCDDNACGYGCEQDTDCLSGFECSGDGTCAESECRSTVLDCYAGQFCQNGSCFDAGPPLCKSCNAMDVFDAIIDGGGNVMGYTSCGGIGAFCLAFEQGGAEYCWTPCTTTEDCPAAFECIEIVNSQTQQVIAKNCIGPCWEI
jgi:hypothetical protein